MGITHIYILYQIFFNKFQSSINCSENILSLIERFFTPTEFKTSVTLITSHLFSNSNFEA